VSSSSVNTTSQRYRIWYDALYGVDRRDALNETVDAELAELPEDMRARLVRISELIGSVGLPNVKEPHVSPYPRPALGDSPQGKIRHSTRALRHRNGAACGNP
jgi:hypothetical protein